MHRFIATLARGMALLGGAVLGALVVMTCLSILGRQVNTLMHAELVQSVAPGVADWALATGVGPIFGDYEMTEMGMAFALFCFLPLCQLTSAMRGSMCSRPSWARAATAFCAC